MKKIERTLDRTLKVLSIVDFCIRCDDIYDYFWEYYAPFFDIAIYRDYLLYEAKLSNNRDKQEIYAGLAWEFLNGDISISELYGCVRFRNERCYKIND